MLLLPAASFYFQKAMDNLDSFTNKRKQMDSGDTDHDQFNPSDQQLIDGLTWKQQAQVVSDYSIYYLIVMFFT